jgi:cytochrome c553
VKSLRAVFSFPLVVFFSVQLLAQSSNKGPLPIWAYPVEKQQTHSAAQMATADQTIQHVPHSQAGYTKAQIADLFTVPDWFPDAHPAMPHVVSNGRKPALYACGYCHLPNGLGRPENASVAGLPKRYIEQQMADFRDGNRKSSESRMGSVSHMIAVAKAARPDEVEAAANYFSSLKFTPWIQVIETDEAPRTRIAGGMLVVVEGSGKEPIGNRILEVPRDLERTELRDPTSGFIAYVPRGTLAKGRELVMTGSHGKTTPCTACHGADLRGAGDVPSIAGRSPSQMTRQIIDIQRGARRGASVVAMQAPVAHLTEADIVAITGYLASLKP